MQIYVRVKAAGKRKDVLTPTPYTIPDHITDLRQFLTAVVESEVDRYNQKDTETQLIPYLTAQEVEDQAAAGKVSFGTIYSDKKANKEKAVQNAIQCFQDGLVRVLIGEEELTDLDKPVVVQENTVFTFIRLTFLAGRMW